MNTWEERLSDEGAPSPQQSRVLGLAALVFLMSAPGGSGAVVLALDGRYLAVLPALGSSVALVLAGRALLRFRRQGAGPSAWRSLLEALALGAAGVGLLVLAGAGAGT